MVGCRDGDAFGRGSAWGRSEELRKQRARRARGRRPTPRRARIAISPVIEEAARWGWARLLGPPKTLHCGAWCGGTDSPRNMVRCRASPTPSSLRGREIPDPPVYPTSGRLFLPFSGAVIEVFPRAKQISAGLSAQAPGWLEWRRPAWRLKLRALSLLTGRSYLQILWPWVEQRSRPVCMRLAAWCECTRHHVLAGCSGDTGDFQVSRWAAERLCNWGGAMRQPM